MSLTPSNMMPLGTIAPDFTLPDTLSGKKMSFSDVQSPIATVVMFICNHCPYVIHLEDHLVNFAKQYQDRGIQFVAISANDVNSYPQDAPEQMTVKGTELGFSFPYLYDETQAVAKAYNAACTPDFFVFDGDKKCVYRGQYDSSRPGNDTPTGKDLGSALDALLAGNPVDSDQIPSMGCNIKWKETDS